MFTNNNKSSLMNPPSSSYGFGPFFNDTPQARVNAWDQAQRLPKDHYFDHAVISNTIVEGVAQLPSDLTGKILPLKFDPGAQKVNWCTMAAHPQILDSTPRGATARTTTFKKSYHSKSLITKGINFNLPLDFQSTKEGKQAFGKILAQIVSSTNETLSLSVLHALISVDDPFKQLEHECCSLYGKSYRSYLGEKYALWNAIRKPNGAAVVQHYAKQRMSAFKGQCDTVILPEIVVNYYTSIPEEMMNYSYSGPRGDSTRYGYENSLRLRDQFGGNAILPVPTFSNEFITGSRLGVYDPLLCDRQIGGFHHMLDPMRGKNQYNSHYSTSCRDTMIYCEDTDQFKIITLQQALDGCGRWDHNGNLISFTTMSQGSMNSYDVGNSDDMYSPTQKSLDTFHYMDGEGNVQPSLLMGQLNGLHEDDVRDWVSTFMKSICSGVSHGSLVMMHGTSLDEMISVWNKGMRIIDKMHSPIKITSKDKWDEYSKAIGKLMDTSGIISINDDDEDTSMVVLKKTMKDFGFFPGFGSYHGLKSIQKSVEVNESLKKERSEFNDIYQFMELLDSLVDRMMDIFPHHSFCEESLVGNMKYVSSSSTFVYDIFYENAVLGRRKEEDLFHFNVIQYPDIGDLSGLINFLKENSDLKTLDESKVIDYLGGIEMFERAVGEIDYEEHVLFIISINALMYSMRGRNTSISKLYKECEGNLVGYLNVVKNNRELIDRCSRYPLAKSYHRLMLDKKTKDIITYENDSDIDASVTINTFTSLECEKGDGYTLINEHNTGVLEIHKCKNFIDLLDSFSGKSSRPSLENALAICFLYGHTRKEVFDSFVHQHLMVPIDFLLFRPHQSYRNYSCIFVKSGTETGSTIVGDSNFESGVDPQTQTLHGSYRIRFGTVVKNRSNVLVVPDAFVASYEGGRGMEIFATKDQYNPLNGVYNNSGDSRCSIFVSAVPRSCDLKGLCCDSIMDIKGHFENEEVTKYGFDPRAGMKQSNGKNLMYHYPSAVFENMRWGWESMGLGSSMESFDDQVADAPPNTIVFQDHTLYRNVNNMDFTLYRPGCGPFDSNRIYSGCRKAMSSENSAEPPQFRDWSKDCTPI